MKIPYEMCVHLHTDFINFKSHNLQNKVIAHMKNFIEESYVDILSLKKTQYCIFIIP